MYQHHLFFKILVPEILHVMLRGLPSHPDPSSLYSSDKPSTKKEKNPLKSEVKIFLTESQGTL